MTFIFYSALFLFIGLCALLCLVVLIQESKSMGLGSLIWRRFRRFRIWNLNSRCFEKIHCLFGHYFYRLMRFTLFVDRSYGPQ